MSMNICQLNLKLRRVRKKKCKDVFVLKGNTVHDY